MVRLITHNLLACHFRDVQIELREAEFNPEFLKGFMPKLEWKALVDAARQLGDTTLPLEVPEMLDDEFLKNLHHVLLEIHVEEGVMSCPNCKHDYPILNGIPNMLLAEHEIG
ncbi:hypothetical protein C0995_003894 [Termitomyces sp. Mi166|nr:hypothetical protein C0995_003894 [Termitomyces sp. Mi166\